MKIFAPGDIVTVRFSMNDVLPDIQQGQMETDCIILHLPAGAGDHFQFRTNDEHGIKFSLNPLNIGFVGIIHTGKKVPVIF